MEPKSRAVVRWLHFTPDLLTKRLLRVVGSNRMQPSGERKYRERTSV